MPLFSTTAEIELLIPSLDKNMGFSRLLPFVEQAEIKYIIPVVSQAFYDELIAAQAGSPSAAQTAAITRIQRALAYYAVYNAAPILNVNVGTIGIQERNSSEGTSGPATLWRTNEFRAQLLTTADDYLEDLITYLEANKASYSTWTGSTAYSESKELILNNGKELSEHITLSNARRVYIGVRPYIILSEKKHIAPAIGQDLFDQLKTQIASGSFTGQNQELYNRLKLPLAHLAMYEAIPNLSLSIGANGFRLISESDGNTSKTSADDKRVQALRSNAHTNGISFLADVKAWMEHEDNINDFDLYTDSDAYGLHRQPKTDLMDNSQDRGTFSV